MLSVSLLFWDKGRSVFRIGRSALFHLCLRNRIGHVIVHVQLTRFNCISVSSFTRAIIIIYIYIYIVQSNNSDSCLLRRPDILLRHIYDIRLVCIVINNGRNRAANIPINILSKSTSVSHKKKGKESRDIFIYSRHMCGTRSVFHEKGWLGLASSRLTVLDFADSERRKEGGKETERNDRACTSFRDGVTPIYISRRQKSATSSLEFHARCLRENENEKTLRSAPYLLWMILNFVYAQRANGDTYKHLAV